MFEKLVNEGLEIETALFDVSSIWDTNTHAGLTNFLHELQQSISRLVEAPAAP